MRRYFVGNGVHELMRRLLPASEAHNLELGKTLLAKYTAEYNNRWHNKTRPYPGIVDLLKQLKQNGLTLSVFSNKPDEFTNKCIRHFFGDELFSVVRGGRDDTPRKPAPEESARFCHGPLSIRNRFCTLATRQQICKRRTLGDSLPLEFCGDSEREKNSKKTMLTLLLTILWKFSS